MGLLAHNRMPSRCHQEKSSLLDMLVHAVVCIYTMILVKNNYVTSSQEAALFVKSVSATTCKFNFRSFLNKMLQCD